MHNAPLESSDFAQNCLRTAIRIIDKEFGHEYAKKNPKLVADLAKIIFEAAIELGEHVK